MSKSAAQKHVVAVDIGYSNVKIAYGDAKGNPETIVRPAQAAPMDQVSGGVEGNKEAYCVMVDDKPWLAFVNPEHITVPRELTRDYPSTDAYKALFYAGILAVCPEGKVIDHLITGLPINQYQQQGKVDALIKRLEGVHQVAPQTAIEVKKVTVLAQPVGTMLDVYCNHEDGEMLTESTVLVLDPGFFSVDWVLFNNKTLAKDFSGGNYLAMSKMFDAINDEIRNDFGVGPGAAKIEHVLQSSNPNIIDNPQRAALAPYIERAKIWVTKEALASLRTGMHFMGDQSIDFVVLGGGGAFFYQDEIQSIYPNSRIIQAENPVISNVIGFWLHGVDQALPDKYE